ncbi:hypothetical protein ACFXO9_08495 [Nocardia tengchongensis]|uniref:hypothetical protein n=1 Tax=Nocardia tengchongensis TaxID=2055889 RepID=UPI0036B14D83
MSSGQDGQDIDPERTTSSGDWWQGPVHDRPAPNPIPPPNPLPPPNPPVSGPNPYVSAPNPYAAGPNPYVPGPSPYASGPNPTPPMANSYGTGPAPFPATSPPPGNYPPPPGDRGRLWLLAGIGALVVAIVAIVATVAVMRDSGSTPSPTALPASTTKPVTTAPATTTPSSTLTPRIPGYQVVVPKDLKAAWDIPKDWTIDPSTTTYGTDADHLAAAGFSEEGVDYCPNNVRTNMFLSTSDISDATAAATDVGAHAARLGWSTRTSSQAGTPQPLDAGDNTLHGTFLETTGAFTAPTGCATTFSVYTFAVSAGPTNGALVLVIVADTGVDRSVTPDFARELFASFRLL